MSSNYPEIPEHWAEVVDSSVQLMVSYVPDVKILQVKEKFGGLRLDWAVEGEVPKEDLDNLDMIVCLLERKVWEIENKV